MRIKTQIDGSFEGWTGDTIVKLMNGQAWQQAEYHYHYHYTYMPAVEITLAGGRPVMRVEGVPVAVPVAEVSIECDGSIVSPFTGFERGMTFQFDTGHVWQQVEGTTERHNARRPSAMVVDGPNGTVLKVEDIETVVEVRRVARR